MLRRVAEAGCNRWRTIVTIASCFVTGLSGMLMSMETDTCPGGSMRQCDTPNWDSLQQLLGSDDLCDHFMWMHDVELEDGTVVDAYKHRWTRRYVHLAADGRAFSYAYDYGYEKDCYTPIDAYIAIAVAFERWECCRPTPEDKAALRSAVQRAVHAAG